jgi:ERCC4-type nuclease
MGQLIVVDTNEQATNPTIVNQLRAYFGEANIILSKLTAGDLSIPLATGLLLVERKKPGDLFGSIADGRVFSQVERMAASARFCAIVIHGSLIYDSNDKVIVDGRESNWNGKAVRAAINSIMWSGCLVMNVTSGVFAQAVDELIHLAMKPDHIQKKRKRAITFPPMDNRLDLLSSIPGIGPTRADAILKFVGDIKKGDEYGRLCDALEWGCVLKYCEPSARPAGWGEVTLNKFHDFLGLEDDEVLSVTKTDGHITVDKAIPVQEETDDATETET